MKKYALLFLLLTTLLGNAQNNQVILVNHFNANSSQLGLTQEDVSDFKVISSTYSKSMRIDNVYVSQRVDGIEVFNSTSVFGIRDGAVVTSKIGFTANTTQKINTNSPAITAQNAIEKAATAIGISAPTSLQILETKEDNSFILPALFGLRRGIHPLPTCAKARWTLLALTRFSGLPPDARRA